ncbi:MAG TPA: hypothetical protein VG406_19705, partial [Isosphaeraceae bacterium]|nr:hypothetical protein [Isosphaeraceae bacterium]
MKYFEASGLWYPSDDPANAVGGTLKFNVTGLQLFLLGSFRQGWSPRPEPYPFIYGVVGDSPYGTFVTLIDCFRTGQKFNSVGATSESIRCNRAVVGNCHLPEEGSRFGSLELDFSYLNEWVGPGGIKIEERPISKDDTYLVSYKKPNITDFTFGDKSVILGFNFKSKEDIHKVSLSEEARLVVQPVGELKPAALGQDSIQNLQNLLSLATDRPN